MARTMEIKLVLGGVPEASANLRRLERQAQQLASQTQRLAMPALGQAPPSVAAPLPQVRPPKFLSGPRQTLQKIQEQRAQLAQVADPVRRQAISEDLDQKETLAKRSVTLHERRKKDPDLRNGKGLLELFRDLNQAMGALQRGDPAGALMQTARGVQSVITAAKALGAQSVARTGMSAPARMNLPIPHSAPTLPPVGGGGLPPIPQLPGGGAAAGRMGRVVASLGKVGVAAGAVVVALAAVVLAYKAFVDVIKTAADALSKFKDDTLVTGGNEKSTAFLGQLGLDPKTAMGFRASLDDPVAYGAAASVGVRTGGPLPYGRLDSGKMLEQFIKNVSKIDNRNERLRKATAVGNPELIGAIEKYRRHGATIDKDTARKAKIFDPESQQAAGDLQFQLGRVAEGFQEILTALGKPFLRDAATWVEAFANTLKDTASWLNDNQAAIKAVAVALSPVVAMFTGIPALFANIGKFPAMIHDAFVGAIKNVVSFVQKHFPVVAEVFSNVFNAVLGFIKGIAMAIAGVMGGPKAQADLAKQFESAEKQFQKWLEPMLKSNSEARLAKAIDENTKATQDLTIAMPTGTHGGGPRAHGAIPSHLKGILLSKAIAGNSLRLGAFVP